MALPIEDAHRLVGEVYSLPLKARRARQQLTAMQAQAAEAERSASYALGLASSLEDGLRRTLEEALVTLKAGKDDGAEA